MMNGEAGGERRPLDIAKSAPHSKLFCAVHFFRAGCANNNLRAGFLRNVKGKSQAAP
jgi:hypothetical protein